MCRKCVDNGPDSIAGHKVVTYNEQYRQGHQIDLKLCIDLQAKLLIALRQRNVAYAKGLAGNFRLLADIWVDMGLEAKYLRGFELVLHPTIIPQTRRLIDEAAQWGAIVKTTNVDGTAEAFWHPESGGLETPDAARLRIEAHRLNHWGTPESRARRTRNKSWKTSDKVNKTAASEVEEMLAKYGSKAVLGEMALALQMESLTIAGPILQPARDMAVSKTNPLLPTPEQSAPPSETHLPVEDTKTSNIPSGQTCSSFSDAGSILTPSQSTASQKTAATRNNEHNKTLQSRLTPQRRPTLPALTMSNMAQHDGGGEQQDPRQVEVEEEGEDSDGDDYYFFDHADPSVIDQIMANIFATARVEV